MLLSSIFPSLLLAVSLLSEGISARAVSNFTLGSNQRRATASTSGSTLKCTTVSGMWLGFNYNFGCLCENDVESFCNDHGISSLWQAVISSQVSSKGSSYFYPNNAQPSCDGSGGYTCGSLSRSSGGQCSSTTCDPQKVSSNGGCCPRGQTYKDGKCCGAVGCKSNSSQCTPALSCPTYTSNGICCPSGTSGWTGYTTVCCPKGQIENGSTGKCITNCQSGYEYNSSKGKCEPICDTSNGYIYQQTSTGKDICCKSGMKACQTVCCPVNQPEVGDTGVCCPSGSQVTNGKCTTPTGKSTNHRRVARQFQEALTASSFYGLAANAKGALCPSGLAACPIGDFASSGQYECLDPLADLQSCGGCESMGTGKDCTVIPGARWMGCNQGVCEVYSCNNGWKRNSNGTECERLL
ncbi:hypothetical protein CNBG_2155 [Cryptococcus deuterogattii R265]|uniref:Protein CPL1-like domain-containing protein n=1 Tax=Cryptococcus deuterogattii (strain R265) TaxID=294750 RepID=A0A095C714_CRYD2|nr:hypothetical protein CNBG_2155 [Cryptococcus deuterogattii R265]KIR28259.1 hypothetical protein I309_02909 [Cryptococcus deuterogattii LA55]KIR73361.1 hypothetical protein I310_03027 [Cryptococcus deuterogattii CA1014]KIR91696.1 hypothetical protein I304_04520 [Cryptococcus deuterogattii CBS 10090]